jgi:hypothetical protein
MLKAFWPDVSFYKQERMMIESVRDNDETFVAAGNKLGKDYTAAFIALHFFLTRTPCRVVTTSAKDDHLRVLWSEIMKFVRSSRIPLDVKRGGILLCNHHDMRKLVGPDYQERCEISYMIGMVAGKESIAAMQGHHVPNTGDGVPRTLFISDESSSVRNEYAKMARTWCNRLLAIGNTWPCNNFFRHAVTGKPGSKDRGGDLPRRHGKPGYYRKIIKIKATDSPNVALGLWQQRHGLPATGKLADGSLPCIGVKSYDEYEANLATWDDIQIAVALNAEWYSGPKILLFPKRWLANSAMLAYEKGYPVDSPSSKYSRKALAIGCDPGEGQADSCWSIVDKEGLLKQHSLKTPDTSDITEFSIELIRTWNIPHHMMMFDRGGGGKQIADAMRRRGYRVRTVAFGESPMLNPRRGTVMVEERMDNREQRYAYVNRRAEMYGTLRELLNPKGPLGGFAIPPEYTELFRQMEPIPLTYDSEGRLRLLPKHPSKGSTVIDSDVARDGEETLVSLLGCSPDELDSLVVALHALSSKHNRPKATSNKSSKTSGPNDPRPYKG